MFIASFVICLMTAAALYAFWKKKHPWVSIISKYTCRAIYGIQIISKSAWNFGSIWWPHNISCNFNLILLHTLNRDLLHKSWLVNLTYIKDEMNLRLYKTRNRLMFERQYRWGVYLLKLSHQCPVSGLIYRSVLDFWKCLINSCH